MRYQIITYLTVKSPPQAKIFRNPGYFSEKITSEVITKSPPPFGHPPFFRAFGHPTLLKFPKIRLTPPLKRGGVETMLNVIFHAN